MQRKNTYLTLLLCICLSGLALATSADAHGLKIFASPDGDAMEGYVYFTSGAACQGVEVQVQSQRGAQLAVVKTDNEGRFRYVPKTVEGIRFVVETMDGHRATFDLDAAANGNAGDEITQAESETTAWEYSAADKPEKGGLGGEQTADAELQHVVRMVVQQEIRPLREQLERHSERVKLEEIVSGIGYIVGLLGVVAILKSRKRAD